MPIPPREQEFFEMARARRLRPARNGFVDKTLHQLAVFFSDALLREETARRLGLLQRLDPRARLLGTLFFVLSVSLARSIPALAAHAVLVAAALWLSRLRLREIMGAGLLIALVFSTLMALPATLHRAATMADFAANNSAGQGGSNGGANPYPGGGNRQLDTARV